MKVLGLVPARGGSKGVPGKNIKLLAGAPLIGYTAYAAIHAGLLVKTILSTDDPAIAEVGRSLGLEVPFLRPAELAADTTPTLPVIQHALRFLESLGEHYDAVCLLQATAPFRPMGFIDNAIRKFSEEGTDSLMSVLPVPHEYNPHWTFEPGTDGRLRIATGEEKIIKRRQDLPKCYYRSGSLYLTRTEVIMNQNSVYGKSVSFVESDPAYHCNIDTLQDWAIAEQKVEHLKFQ